MDTEELKKLAEAAKGWKLNTVIPATDERRCEVGAMMDDEFYPLITLECEDYYKDSVPLANYIIAASPDVVLKLIEERDDLASQVASLNAGFNSCQKKRDALYEALKNLQRGYLNLLETGRDRIVMAGGQCDSVEMMEANDPNLKASRAALALVGEQT